ncbi:hypothetical protein R3P38DRAFT_2771086 [Favolaschia claudopus]|uniref:Uncharacterized protein n=1 Tax=Favolaschia claudopus TaxID=2862362 RepID=A0AAW0CE10_9AGAR
MASKTIWPEERVEFNESSISSEEGYKDAQRYRKQEQLPDLAESPARQLEARNELSKVFDCAPLYTAHHVDSSIFTKQDGLANNTTLNLRCALRMLGFILLGITATPGRKRATLATGCLAVASRSWRRSHGKRPSETSGMGTFRAQLAAGYLGLGARPSNYLWSSTDDALLARWTTFGKIGYPSGSFRMETGNIGPRSSIRRRLAGADLRALCRLHHGFLAPLA